MIVISLPVAHAKDLLYCPILPGPEGAALLTRCQTYNPAPLCAITYERLCYGLASCCPRRVELARVDD